MAQTTRNGVWYRNGRQSSIVNDVIATVKKQNNVRNQMIRDDISERIEDLSEEVQQNTILRNGRRGMYKSSKPTYTGRSPGSPRSNQKRGEPNPYPSGRHETGYFADAFLGETSAGHSSKRVTITRDGDVKIGAGFHHSEPDYVFINEYGSGNTNRDDSLWGHLAGQQGSGNGWPGVGASFELAAKLALDAPRIIKNAGARARRRGY